MSVLEEGPLRAAVSAELKYGQSTINVVVRSPLLLDLLKVIILSFQISLHAVNGLSAGLYCSTHRSLCSRVLEAERSTVLQF